LLLPFIRYQQKQRAIRAGCYIFNYLLQHPSIFFFFDDFFFLVEKKKGG